MKDENTFMLQMMTLLVMSHLTGCAVMDQGPDNHSFLGLLQAESKIYVILEFEKKGGNKVKL